MAELERIPLPEPRRDKVALYETAGPEPVGASRSLRSTPPLVSLSLQPRDKFACEKGSLVRLLNCAPDSR
jgi:hypothetical protein